ncbi:MAG: phosphoribosylamine--glycine ligase [Syntrophaceticus sp.]|nr:phosphoribosylamine--glycine ligase [Syntrophaceticus sp.]MDD4360320.1 phosphoribosylamine--glycine ligase [Syntrophaceticus sp.]MDD4783446.1 phosphoribosylamine--glycine ligase [Syntrophaceticus sp.]HBG22711.1 phosphoribosylamine--glycine ligase [Peptococcaceae bacterium]
MKVLVVGGGGREHTLVWKLNQSPRVDKIYCAPGNGGIAGDAKCVPLAADDITGLADFAQEHKIDLTVVGPEAPLAAGIVDHFTSCGLRVFGPDARGARLEGSKVFAKEVMTKYGVLTAAYKVFQEPAAALDFVRKLNVPCVVKANGLAAGKGVIIAQDAAEAEDAVKLIMEERAFGEAGTFVVVEELLQGEEVSILAFTDGKAIKTLVASQDHKRVGDGDQGLNTGGMGAYSPPPVYTEDIHASVCRDILEPVIYGLAEDGIKYKGVIYAGLMLTQKGVYVLEFNCRFGDPEAQVVIPRLQTDLVDVIDAIIDERLDEVELEWDPRPAVCVVMASSGYPGAYEKGKLITGLDQLPPGVLAFHAGTALTDGKLVSNGGRVLGITAFGATIEEAVQNVYAGVEKVNYQGMHYRRDIAHRALNKGS